MESTKIISNSTKIITGYYNFCYQKNNMTTKPNFKKKCI